MATGFPLSIDVGDPVAKAKARPPAAPRTPTPKAEAPPAAPQGDLVSRYQTAMEEPMRELEQATEYQQKFDIAQKEDLAAREAARARSRGAALEAEKTAIESAPAMQRLTEVERAMETPFAPTKDNAMDLATLYSLIGVVGFAIGAGGKGNAIAAMSAMNGMAEGHRKGRMDLYAREKDQFDTNLKQLKTRAETLSKELERITKIAAYDRQRADLEADALFSEQGGSFIKDFVAKYGYSKGIDLAKQNATNIQKIFELKEKQEETARNKAEERAFRLELARMQDATRRDIAEMRAGGAVGGKLTEKDRAAHRLRQNLIPELEEGIDILDRINKEGKWSKMTTLLALDTRAAEAAFKDDPEALKLIRTFAYFRSKEFETGGKALTKMEDRILAPLYRSDLRVYEAVRNAMVMGSQEMSREKQKLEDQFPSLGAGGNTGGRATGKPMPTGAKLKAYTDAHPEFNGSEEAAKAFLRTQGYE